MAYTMKDLIFEAYYQSGDAGTGMALSSDKISNGLMQLNTILDSLYATNAITTTIALPVTFTGAETVTIGVLPDDPLAEQPDIVVPVLPLNIDAIVYKQGQSRYNIKGVDAITYSQRYTDDNTDTIYPVAFYHQKTAPFQSIYFIYGNPSGAGEIIYKAGLVDVSTNTNYNTFPRELKPYLVYELASLFAESSGFDSTSLRIKANKFYWDYHATLHQRQSRIYMDGSTGTTLGDSNRYDYHTDEGY